MGANEPSLPGDRRDSEITSIKKRVAVLEDTLDKTQQLAQGMHYALFGLPDDRLNNGLVGEMHDMKSTLQAANAKLMALVIATLSGVIALVADILTRNL